MAQLYTPKTPLPMSPTPKRRFHTAAESDIKSGDVSDVYFERTVEILRHRHDRKRVKAEIYLKSLPDDWQWGILAGIEEVATLMEGVPVALQPMDEGTASNPYHPATVLEASTFEGRQKKLQLLALLVQPSAFATKPRPCK